MSCSERESRLSYCGSGRQKTHLSWNQTLWQPLGGKSRGLFIKEWKITMQKQDHFIKSNKTTLSGLSTCKMPNQHEMNCGKQDIKQRKRKNEKKRTGRKNNCSSLAIIPAAAQSAWLPHSQNHHRNYNRYCEISHKQQFYSSDDSASVKNKNKKN